jgi:hypothetical protein
MEKNQKYFFAFILFFLTIIYAVPLVQAIAEYRKSKTVQALDIVVDAFITPFQRASRLHELARKQLCLSDSLSDEQGKAGANGSDDSRFLKLADAAEVACGDLKKTAFTVNRHITLGAPRSGRTIVDSLSSILSSLTPRDSEKLPELKRIAGVCTREFPSPGFFGAPFLVIKNLRYIFWNDRYLRPYEKELENNSVFAGFLRPLLQHARFVLFNDLGGKGIQGRSDWYFYTPDVEYLVKPSVLDPRSRKVDPNDKPLADDPIGAILNFKKQLAGRGIDLLVVIVPGKPSVYPDVLSRRITAEKAAAFSHSIGIMKELRRRGVDVVDLFGPFAEQRRLDPETGDSMYLRQDTHWKPRALRCAARAVAQRIKTYPWYTPGAAEYAIDSIVVEKVGDVAVMSGQAILGGSDRKDGFASEKVMCYQVKNVQRDESGGESGRAVYKDDFRSSKILVLGDSYSRIYQTDEPRGAGWIAHLAYELSQPVASVVNDGGASTLARRSLARRIGLLKGKKLVVWEIVERDFRFGDDGWKDVALGVGE